MTEKKSTDTPPFRIGFGLDVHRFLKADSHAIHKPLILGGVKIDNHIGLEAHSDGDVVLHSLCDAILGALALDDVSDIGDLFPDTDERYKNQSSLYFLEVVLKLATEKGYQIGNVDITVSAQTPKLKNYKIAIKNSLAKLLKVNPSQVNLKATTTEKLDAVGKKKGIYCYAVLLLNRNQ